MSNNHKYPYEAQQEINDLERQLEASRQRLARVIQEAYEEGFYDAPQYIRDSETLEVCWQRSDSIFEVEKLTTKSEGGEKC